MREAKEVDTAALLEQIRGAESTNRQVRENHQRQAAAAEHAVAERQAWTIHAGDLARAAAGVIHSDFEKFLPRSKVVS